MTKNLNNNMKWLISLIMIIITLLSVGGWIQSVRGDIEILKAEQTKKVSKELYQNDITWIKKELKEIKELVKEKNE